MVCLPTVGCVMMTDLPVLSTAISMSLISPYQVQGKWRHSGGGDIEIAVDNTGKSVIITHPTVGKQTMDVAKFCQGDGLDYFGFKGKLDDQNTITWNNGVMWQKTD